MEPIYINAENCVFFFFWIFAPSCQDLSLITFEDHQFGKLVLKKVKGKNTK